MQPKEKGRCESDPIPNAIVRQDSSESKSDTRKEQVFSAVHPLNKRESLRSELIERHGRTVVRVGRWKSNPDGNVRPAGVGIECSADHIDGFAAMLTATKQHLAKGDHES